MHQIEHEAWRARDPFAPAVDGRCHRLVPVDRVTTAWEHVTCPDCLANAASADSPSSCANDRLTTCPPVPCIQPRSARCFGAE